ncbi:hypothetical protein C8D79_0792 [Bacteriovorax stolpii]|nr:hypothetical protein C8D79_0792 [Bacteriovorax stolpii]
MRAMSFLLILAFFVSSCTTYFPGTQADRSIANDVNPPLNADQLFTIKSTTQTKNGQDFVKAIKGSFGYQGVEVNFIEDAKMASSDAYKIVPTVEGQAYKLQIFYSAQAKIDQDAANELKAVMEQIMNKKFISQFSVFELYYNAKVQDFQTLQVMAKIRQAALVEDLYGVDADYKMRSQERAEYWKQINEKFDSVERVYNKQVKAQDTARRAVMDALDKASDDQQFRALIARNDRKGATELLRKYLPWEQMPPFEKMFWENHLSIMADPLPYEDRVLVYRGINDDIVQVAEVGGKELARAEAIKDQKIFLMSTMMTKNQGTWNRRLRSLTAMYEKFMGTDNNGSSEYTRSTRITTMFVKHSKEPKGSPYLSYTPKFSVASSFGNKRNTAYFIDPRMMYFNYASKYAHEIEFLLPIMSFPDDLAAVWDMELHPEGNGNVEKFLKQKAIEKLDHELGAGKGAATFDRIVLNSEKYFKPVLGGKTGAVVAPKPDGKFIAFFKNLFGMPTKKAAEVITEKSDMACLDLIQLFWK